MEWSEVPPLLLAGERVQQAGEIMPPSKQKSRLKP
jgi:hypothetical protein